LQLQWQFQETTMAFVRKKGKSYYLVHNVREDGHVRQVHLACLGNRPRISNEVLEQVRQSHPQLQIDWAAVRARAADTFVSPFAQLEGVDMLLHAVRTLREDLDELNWDTLAHRLSERGQWESGTDASAASGESQVRALQREMQELRAQLEAKLKHPPAAAPLHSETNQQRFNE